MKKILAKSSLILSVLCAIHCMAFPLMLVALPLVGLQFIPPHGHFELIMLSFVFAIGLPVLYLDFKKHRSLKVLIAFVLGLCLLLVAHLMHDHGILGVLILTIGSVLVVGSQLINFRLRRATH